MSAVIPLSDLATIANNTVLGNISGGAAIPSALTGANVRTICGLATTDSPTFSSVYGTVAGDGVGSYSKFQLSRARNTIASPNDIQNGDYIGEFQFKGYSGGTYFGTATIDVAIDGTFISGGLPPSRFEFTTSGLSGNQITLKLDSSYNATVRNALITGAPAGGTAGAWKGGILITAASVFDTTRYIQLDVDGVLYKLAVCV